MNLNKNTLIEIYRNIVLLRKLDEKLIELFTAGKVPGWIHPYVGQEAVVAGVAPHVRKDDFFCATHRGRAVHVLKGTPLRKFVAELLGRKTGINKGRAGEMHVMNWEVHSVSSGIVGATFPMAVGFGIACKLEGGDKIVFCTFGDGASNRGTFHESLNMASVWKLPIVFICENNLYAQFTPSKLTTSVSDIAKRASAYNMPSTIVDGMDPIAVYEAVGEAVERARKREGPTLVECKTYRYHGHFYGDKWETYRSPEEVEAWKKKDPVITFKERLLKDGVLTEKLVEEIYNDVNSQVEDALKFAFESPEPSPEDVYEDL